jgi:hypothetical protein
MNRRLENSFYHKVVRQPFQLRVNGHPINTFPIPLQDPILDLTK